MHCWPNPVPHLPLGSVDTLFHNIVKSHCLIYTPAAVMVRLAILAPRQTPTAQLAMLEDNKSRVLGSKVTLRYIALCHQQVAFLWTLLDK